MDALRVDKLEKTYKGALAPALGGVSLAIGKGEFYALLGPNGAGKTTLIGIVTGLVEKTGGRVEIFGIDASVEPERTRLKVGVVPQNMNFNIFDKVIDIVVNQAGYYGIPRSVALPRAERILEGVGLSDKKYEQGMKLSGGMQRRLMIARALIHEPALLILDEPTAGVDVEMRRSMWEYLTKLVQQGTTILLTTHYLEEAEQLAKRVAIINKGQIIVEGTMEDVLAKYDESKSRPGYRGSRLEEVFLQLTSDTDTKS